MFRINKNRIKSIIILTRFWMTTWMKFKKCLSPILLRNNLRHQSRRTSLRLRCSPLLVRKIVLCPSLKSRWIAKSTLLTSRLSFSLTIKKCASFKTPCLTRVLQLNLLRIIKPGRHSSTQWATMEALASLLNRFVPRRIRFSSF